MSSPSHQTILITGGAGFIGSHLADDLIRAGHRVRILDRLGAQVHGANAPRPDYLNPEAELIVGDVRDEVTVRRALRHVDAVYHLAAAVGVGRSMSEVRRCMEINSVGTAVLMESLIERPVERLILASSMSVYGEGLYSGPNGRVQTVRERPPAQLEEGVWELYDDEGHVLRPLPTPELKRPAPASIYALSKHDQERLCLILGRAYGIPTTVLRLFNVYGPRQSLTHPSTGVLANFAARYLNDQPPRIYEDGGQMRDFVSVTDVARACRLALESPRAANEIFNIGSGNPHPLWEVAGMMARVLGKSGIEAEVTGLYRKGDIRHCFADISKARERLGYEPGVSLEQGLHEWAAWLEGRCAPPAPSLRPLPVMEPRRSQLTIA